MGKKEKRFVKVYTESGGFSAPGTYILVDRQTGVNYLFTCSGYAGGLCVLVDRDGKPIVTPVSNDYE